MSERILVVLQAEKEIRSQLHKYCRALDRLDRDLLGSVWHSNGKLHDSEKGQIAPFAHLIDGIIDGYRTFATHIHQVTNPFIKIESGRAVSESLVMAILRSHPDLSGCIVDTHCRGRYLDHWSKRDGRWAIDERHIISSFSWEQTVVEGSMGRFARRGLEDPIYGLISSLPANAGISAGSEER